MQCLSQPTHIYDEKKYTVKWTIRVKWLSTHKERYDDVTWASTASSVRQQLRENYEGGAAFPNA